MTGGISDANGPSAVSRVSNCLKFFHCLGGKGESDIMSWTSTKLSENDSDFFTADSIPYMVSIILVVTSFIGHM